MSPFSPALNSPSPHLPTLPIYPVCPSEGAAVPTPSTTSPLSHSPRQEKISVSRSEKEGEFSVGRQVPVQVAPLVAERRRVLNRGRRYVGWAAGARRAAKVAARERGAS